MQARIRSYVDRVGGRPYALTLSRLMTGRFGGTDRGPSAPRVKRRSSGCFRPSLGGGGGEHGGPGDGGRYQSGRHAIDQGFGGRAQASPLLIAGADSPHDDSSKRGGTSSELEGSRSSSMRSSLCLSSAAGSMRPVPARADTDADTFFCSEVIAGAFVEAGVMRGDRHAAYWFPVHFMDGGVFEKELQGGVELLPTVPVDILTLASDSARPVVDWRV